MQNEHKLKCVCHLLNFHVIMISCYIFYWSSSTLKKMDHPLNLYSEDDTDCLVYLNKTDLGMLSDVNHIKVVN